VCRRPRRTGPRWAITAERSDRRGRELRSRYTVDDLAALSSEEASRLVPAGGDPQSDPVLAWELLYRLEPQLYDRLATAERLHPGILRWLPVGLDRIVEVGAGTGRLTLDLLGRGREIVAVEPVAAFRDILRRKLDAAGCTDRVTVADGYFDDLPVASSCADLVVACSVLTPSAVHGGDTGLAEVERVCRPGGCAVIVWPNNVDWLVAHGYHYLSFAGPMSLDFASYREAIELAEIFFPDATREIRRRGSPRVPSEVLGYNSPRDLAFKVIAA
jgi:SAM-dependent methyltransferase